MTSSDHKTMKHLYREALTVATAVINDWDPFGLVAGGAPKDGFEGEVSCIVAKAREAHTPEVQAIVVSEVFSSCFGPAAFPVKACFPVASRLFDEHQHLGFLERRA